MGLPFHECEVGYERIKSYLRKWNPSNSLFMKFPIGIQDFAKIRKDGYVYVDKTALIYRLVHEGSIYFLSRPRRFGKSLLISTLEYYFKGVRDLFDGLAIAGLEKDWHVYPVFHIDFNGVKYEEPYALERLVDDYLCKWESAYGLPLRKGQDMGMRFSRVLESVHEATGMRCVVLVDEYDKPLLDVMDLNLMMRDSNGNETRLEDNNRNTLKAFYSVFKKADAHLQFVLLTGVTKFSQVSVFSGFNQPMDISLNDTYEGICGITKDELVQYFSDQVSEMAEAYRVDADEMQDMLKAQYDGYHFSGSMTDVFNPFSLLNALAGKRIDSYWFSTGTPSYLVRLLHNSHENLNELAGKYYRPADFVDYKADSENPLAMIYQSGYLTIKGFNRRFNTFLLDLPNNEVKEGFVSLLANSYLRLKRDSAVEVMEWVLMLEKGEMDAFRKSLTAFFASIPYTMRRKDNERECERYFQYTFYLLFRLMSTYAVLVEPQQSEGRADCIIETSGQVYIFEFKLDGSADEALAQIESRGYARPYSNDKRKVYKVGASFSSKTGTIDDWKTILT